MLSSKLSWWILVRANLETLISDALDLFYTSIIIDAYVNVSYVNSLRSASQIKPVNTAKG